MNVRRVRIRVEGTVQGVGYRASTRMTAHGLGLTGWVRNEPDGAVVLEAQGPTATVDALIAWCRRGPGLAEVERLDVAELDAVDAERGFDVRHR
jgi:acylphosphatase